MASYLGEPILQYASTATVSDYSDGGEDCIKHRLRTERALLVARGGKSHVPPPRVLAGHCLDEMIWREISFQFGVLTLE